MQIKMISDTAARVQVKGDILEKIVRAHDKHCGGEPVSVNGCWILKGSGGWVTIAAFGSDEQAQGDLVRDLEALSDAEQDTD